MDRTFACVLPEEKQRKPTDPSSSWLFCYHLVATRKDGNDVWAGGEWISVVDGFGNLVTRWQLPRCHVVGTDFVFRCHGFLPIGKTLVDSDGRESVLGCVALWDEPEPLSAFNGAKPVATVLMDEGQTHRINHFVLCRVDLENGRAHLGKQIHNTLATNPHPPSISWNGKWVAWFDDGPTLRRLRLDSSFSEGVVVESLVPWPKLHFAKPRNIYPPFVSDLGHFWFGEEVQETFTPETASRYSIQLFCWPADSQRAVRLEANLDCQHLAFSHSSLPWEQHPDRMVFYFLSGRSSVDRAAVRVVATPDRLCVTARFPTKKAKEDPWYSSEYNMQLRSIENFPTPPDLEWHFKTHVHQTSGNRWVGRTFWVHGHPYSHGVTTVGIALTTDSLVNLCAATFACLCVQRNAPLDLANLPDQRIRDLVDGFASSMKRVVWK